MTMNEDDVKWISLHCPVCGHMLLRVTLGSVIEIKCWRSDCSKPILRYPVPQLQIVKYAPSRMKRDIIPNEALQT